MKKTGTREWSDQSFNCVNGCLYCYARAGRFNTKRGAAWITEEPHSPPVRKYDGVVMFPTRHDFTAENYRHCLACLEALMACGNNVLVVTKSDRDIAYRIATVLHKFPLGRSEVRYTLSHTSREVGQFWEPGAPSAKDRIEALGLLSALGYRTSVSCEPWLEDLSSLVNLVGEVSKYVSETIWIGHANKLRQRCAWCMTPQLDAAITIIEARQTPEAARAVYDALKGNPKVRWKDRYWTILEVDQ